MEFTIKASADGSEGFFIEQNQTSAPSPGKSGNVILSALLELSADALALLGSVKE